MNKLSKKTNFKVPKSLLFFGLVSFLFWMLIKLSKTYENKQNFTLEYINLPTDKLLQNEPLKEIQLIIEGSGFKLFASKFINKKIEIDVKPLRKKSNAKNYVLLPTQKGNIENQLKNGVKIVSFSNDSIFFDFGYLATKKIPIVADYKISYKTGFDLASKVIFKPDSVTISGPDKTIDTINNIQLDFLDLKEVDKDINREIKLNPFTNLKNVNITESKVFMTASVEKFTEGEVEIPFTVLNLPVDTQINTFPKTVKIIYKVGLTNFNNVATNSFSVVCNYQYSKENNLSYLIPKLVRNSEFSSNEKIVPNKIDFLIQK